MTAIAAALTRLRGALKSLAYSGFRRDRWQEPERVLSALAVQDGRRVLDLGAGGGYFTFRLASAVGPEGLVYAVDPDADMRWWISRRAERGGYDNVIALDPNNDAPALPEPIALVLVVDAFHHLPGDRVAYFEHLARTLAPEGRVAVIEPLPRWYLFGHATPPDLVRAALRQAGYRLTAEHDFLPRQSFLVFERPR